MGLLRDLRIKLGLRRPKLIDHFPGGKPAGTEPFPGVEIGRRTYGIGEQHLKWFGPGSVLKVGAFCSISQEVVFISNHMHSMRRLSTFPLLTNEHQDPQPIVIGNDVLIGFRAVILPGVTIGNGAVIGAGSVVDKDVPPYAIVAGNRATVRHYRFDPATIALLQKTQWWDWPDDKIAIYAEAFLPIAPPASRTRRHPRLMPHRCVLPGDAE